MLERLSRTKRNLALAGIGILILWFAWTVRTVLNPLILGYLLAYILHPLVVKLERKGWRRGRAVNLIYITAFLAITLFGVAVFQQTQGLVRAVSRASTPDGRTRESGSLVGLAIDRLEHFVQEHESWFAWMIPQPAEEAAPPDPSTQTVTPGEGVTEEGPLVPGVEGGDQTAAPVEEPFTLELLLEGLWERLGEEGATGDSGAAVRGATGMWHIAQRVFGSLMALVSMVLLLPIYSYFLLFELDRIHAFVLRYLPKRERERFSRIGHQIGEVLANFFRGRLLVCVLKGAYLSLALAIAGVDYALLLGMTSGLLSLVPFVGPMVGFVFASLVALLDPDYGVVSALLRTGIVFGSAEILEGYFLLPKILGDSLGLHPVVVLVSIFVGGSALGMFGILIALPLTASLVILARELVLPALEDFAEEDQEVAPPA